MGKFRLALGLHNHQPVGNFEHVFEEAHQQSYSPFLQLLAGYENISLSLHQSGILYDWQEKHHPEHFDLIKSLIDRGQIELMTGGFYEPILTSIPERDVLGQIKMLSGYLKKHFSSSAKGLWLTERIWEPHLPKLLAQAGVKYLPVDDTHFLYSGFEQEQLTGPFITEYEGHTVRLLPIQKKLRYLIPFGTVEKVIEELKRQAETNPEGMAVYADDGEKFGVWPKTWHSCFEERWLERFFEALEWNSDWLEVITLGQAAKDRPVGRAYLPSASYAEMLHWSLPPKAFAEYEHFETFLEEEKQLDRYSRFVRGGHWRGFLAKYDESNLMHKKMLSVSDRLNELEQSSSDNDTNLTDARSHLYAGQCNCPYWHGVFGGLYLPHIRQAIYSNLIAADHLLDSVAPNSRPVLSMRDHDADGYDEALVATDRYSAIFKPNRGGMLLELNLNRHNFSLTDTLTRRKEGYHIRLEEAVLEGDTTETDDSAASIHDIVLTKEAGLSKYLVEDWYLKRCFIDHFLTDEVDIETFASGKFGEEGDFIAEPYECELDHNSNCVVLRREGNIWRPEGVIPVTVVKQFSFSEDDDHITIDYELSTRNGASVDVNFAIENSFNFQAGHADDRYVAIDNKRSEDSFLDSTASHPSAFGVAMIDEYQSLAVEIESDKSAEIWQMPIFTVSLSEGGFEKVYQGTTLINKYRLHLSSEPTRIRLRLFAGSLAERESRTETAVATDSA